MVLVIAILTAGIPVFAQTVGLLQLVFLNCAVEALSIRVFYQ
jgi:hypothetical protein